MIIRLSNLTFSLLGAFLCLQVTSTVSSKEIGANQQHTFEGCCLLASEQEVGVFIPPEFPIAMRNLRPLALNLQSNNDGESVEIELQFFEPRYSDAVPEQAKRAIDYACAIWETHLHSTAPIRVGISWEKEESDQVLAREETNHYVVRHGSEFFPSHVDSAAVADRIQEKDNRPGCLDFNINVNSTFASRYYMGTDGNCARDQYDLVTVILHEIAHGLGFLSKASSFSRGGAMIGALGLSDVDWTLFDYYLQDGAGRTLIDPSNYENPSHSMQQVMTSDSVYFGGPIARQCNSGVAPKIYAPSNFSGVSHLDETTYPPGTLNAMMTPDVGLSEVNHNPGPILCGILKDIGWDHVWIEHKGRKDVEDLDDPINISIPVHSDSPIAGDPILHYRSTYEKEFRSVILTEGTEPGIYSASFSPGGSESRYEYYIEILGSANRIFRYPESEASNYYSFQLGPDLTAPVIEHTPLKFVFSNRSELEIPFELTDNFELNSVEVQVWFDDQMVREFSIEMTGDDSVSVKLDLPDMSSYQRIYYRIAAMDNAANSNRSSFPLENRYPLPIVNVFPATDHYKSDFELLLDDWYLDEFTIQPFEGFLGKSLQSNHPYDSAEIARKNAHAFLKRPIQVLENSRIDFDEIVLVQPTSTGGIDSSRESADYVLLEASKDGGVSWFALTAPYNARSHSLWLSLYNKGMSNTFESESTPLPIHFVRREISLVDNTNLSIGDVILIRFRLSCDELGSGWGWLIDNLEIHSVLGD